MLYKENWEDLKKRYIEYWNLENHDRPLISIKGIREGYAPKTIAQPETIARRWTDTEYVIKSAREEFSSQFYGAEAFPNLCPNLGPDILGAILGDDMEFGINTCWSKHTMNDWENASFKFDPENKWWKKIKEMTAEITDDAQGDYLVGVTDLHPGADALVSLRGPENLSCDLYDYPEKVKPAIFEITEVLKRVYDELNNIIVKKQQGSTNWMGVWHPGRWYVTSCDFIGMISREMFKEFILDELIMEIDWLDASIFHLDGPGALKHLDDLLAIPKLKGIQWVYGAGQPTASHWIPVLKKIQDAGKLIHISAQPDDLDVLLEQLRPEGLLLSIVPVVDDITGNHFFTEEQAKDIIKRIDSFRRREVF
jgi:hypothetical protein